MALLTPEIVYRRNEVMGVPDSGPHNPDKDEIIQLLNLLFGTSRGGWVVARTVAELNTVTPANATDGGLVLTGTGAGYYDRDGSAWVFGRGFPDSFAKVMLSGSGNAQTGAVKAGVVPSSTEVFFANVVTPNTGAMTLSIAGGPVRSVRSLSGSPLAPGEWSGTVLFYLNSSDQYQLIFDAGAATRAANSASAAAASASDALVYAGTWQNLQTATQEAESDANRAEAARSVAESLVVPPMTLMPGRVSALSGVGISEADIANATTLYYVPLVGAFVPIYNGTIFASRGLLNQIAHPLDATSTHTNFQEANLVYDEFLFWTGSEVKMGNGPAWSAGGGSQIARGTGAGSTEIEMYLGLPVNKYPIDIRWGAGASDITTVPARRATYVGSFMPTARGVATDTKRQRLLFKAHNAVDRLMFSGSTTASYTYSAGAFRIIEGNVNNRMEFLFGLSGQMVEANASANVVNNVSDPAVVRCSIGLDSVTVPAPETLGIVEQVNNYIRSIQASYKGNPGLGFHYLAQLEFGAAANTQTWFNYSAGAYRAGMAGTYRG